ncbi:FadR family transcriptional regulator [Arhodomonas aquaeolei]|uniref:FadR/GntR family transcriptional regulator n=1 Tax=Arhodomonas aquaeolei TaxID=2369 RepID=UPI00216892C3|nr:FadR/GntR family transcriptional regulator [Arhodomonas aquaeolei]MCS4505866.1 FadR family transcriptional regulator [Arhodomonas aquaeolei]
MTPKGRTTGRDLGRQLAESLAADLFAGRYRPGDFLPKETELCELFDMSRASVRSGLQLLQSLGIIARTAGQGTRVEEFRDWNILDPVVMGWMAEHAVPNPEFLREIYEFRHAVEPFVAMTAASRATARDLVAMEEAFAGMEAAVESGGLQHDGEAFSDNDIAFHAAIYRATHNLVWSQLATILRPSILLVIRKSNDTADELRDSLNRHRHLMECIRLRQPEAAREAAQHVLHRTGQDLGVDGVEAAAQDPSAAGRGAG